MSDPVYFQPVIPAGWLFALGALLSVGLLFFEFKVRRPLFPYRLIATCTMVTSLLILAANPSRKIGSSKDNLALLTPGYVKQQVDSLRQQQKIKIIASPGLNSELADKQMQSWDELTHVQSQVKFVFGEGVPTPILHQFPMLQYQSFSRAQAGIQSITLKRFKPYRVEELEGTILTEEPIQIFLRSPEGTTDSVSIDEKGLHKFSLQFTTRQPGQYVYQFVTRTPRSEQINIVPIEVADIEPIKIVLLQAFPTFESTSLKNYLASAGHSLVVRNQIASSRYQFEFINQPERRFQSLKEAHLNEHDLVVLSSSTWNNSLPADRNVLLDAARGGIGIIIFLDEQALRLKDLSFKLERAKVDSAVVKTPEGAVTMPTAGVRISSGIEKSVTMDEKGTAVNGYSLMGRGKIGWQLLTPTFTLLLEDKRSMYAHLWIPLLEATARFKPEPWHVHITSPFPWRKNEPLLFDLVASAPPRLVFDSATVPLQEDIVIDDLWHGTVWPRHDGWNRFQLPEGRSHSFYVSPSGQWQSLSLHQQRQLNQHRAIVHPDIAQNNFELQPWMAWLWATIFLLSASFLWLSPKLSF